MRLVPLNICATTSYHSTQNERKQIEEIKKKIHHRKQYRKQNKSNPRKNEVNSFFTNNFEKNEHTAKKCG